MAVTTAAPPSTAHRHHIAVIPCRWGASRFPGKPLAQLGDKPLLWHVHQRCLEAERLDGVVVATDDERIEEVCHRLGAVRWDAVTDSASGLSWPDRSQRYGHQSA
ncbi:cytidylyltransferase domain-containing protein [Streptomyces sp. NPDC048387]|uniref:cytidylyltransferase domain-containing protein n=1 Tax=Streptomyces sp. NPDC048387 TaxID=3365542 RepID=UPI003718D3AA